jgi:hypothetical protein
MLDRPRPGLLSPLVESRSKVSNQVMEFQEKFICFIDILGFKDLVARAEAREGLPLPQILELLPKLGRKGEREQIERYGPKVCPAARYLQRHLDFNATQVSDCVIMSAEISPAGGINLVSQAWMAVTEMLTKGILCRGYLTRGNIYHSPEHFLGTGYHKALEGETNVTAFRKSADERGTPFVEIDQTVKEYLLESKDRYVIDMFDRLTKDDGTITAIYPFKQLCAKFAITADFDGEKQKTSNQNIRRWIEQMKEGIARHVDRANQNAARKSEQYIAALNKQLAVCDKTDRFIDGLIRPFPGREQ